MTFYFDVICNIMLKYRGKLFIYFGLLQAPASVGCVVAGGQDLLSWLQILNSWVSCVSPLTCCFFTDLYFLFLIYFYLLVIYFL